MADKTIHDLTQISEVTQLSEFPMWDSLNNTTKKATLQQVKELIASGIVAGVSFIGTRAQYEVAKLIPSGQEGYIPSGSLVIITDEDRTYVTSGTGSEQTLSLVARVMSAGDGINISNDDKINADTVTFTGTRAEWELLSSSQKAKYNIVNFTDEELTDDVITDTVESGNMLAVTSNAVAEYMNDQNELSNFEDITLSTNSSSPTTMDYDGFIYVIAQSPSGQSGAQLTFSVFINGVLESYYMASSAYSQNFGATACISVKKGDTVYYTMSNVSKTSTRGRFFKKRDYSFR